MGYNDFHKGFKMPNSNTSNASLPNSLIQKKSFGPRSIDEVIESRFKNRTQEKPVLKNEKKVNFVDYQQNMHTQRNLRNLDK